MTTVQSVIMGAVQGVTEFLPISSSAHLVVIPWIFHMDEGNIHKLTYDVVLHFGTLLSLLVVYAGRFAAVCRDDLRRVREGALGRCVLLKIAVGTIPAGVAGL